MTTGLAMAITLFAGGLGAGSAPSEEREERSSLACLIQRREREGQSPLA
jgi:hypothetical protein